jgi:hypothetical protein
MAEALVRGQLRIWRFAALTVKYIAIASSDPFAALQPDLLPFTMNPVTQIEPKLQFRSLAEETVLAALDDGDPANPIVIEIARLVTAYTSNFQDHVKRIGYIPDGILRATPRWPIEAVAQRLTMQSIQSSDAMN